MRHINRWGPFIKAVAVLLYVHHLSSQRLRLSFQVISWYSNQFPKIFLFLQQCALVKFFQLFCCRSWNSLWCSWILRFLSQILWCTTFCFYFSCTPWCAIVIILNRIGWKRCVKSVNSSSRSSFLSDFRSSDSGSKASRLS